MNIVLLISGVYLIIAGLSIHTKNLKSAIIFKIIPFFLGLTHLFYAAKLFGWIQ